MASFNGIDLGVVQRCQTVAAPKDRQINAYNGVNGLEVNDLGARGGETRIRGVLAGESEYALEAIKGGLLAAQLNGGAYVFVDNKGTTWLNVVVVLFEPSGVRKLLPYGFGIMEEYDLQLLHL